MPNWCQNKTNIYFNDDVKEEKIQKFINDLVIRNENNEKTLNLMKFVPLQENGEYDYDLANQKWGSKWEPFVYIVNYDKQFKHLTLDYDSAWTPINQAWEYIYEHNKNLINQINTDYEELNMGFYGDFQIDKYGVYNEEADLPNNSYLNENNFKKMYRLVKQGTFAWFIPDKLIEDIEQSENYQDFFNKHFANDNNNIADYDFDEVWDEYINKNNNRIYYDLLQEMKKENLDYDKYLDNALKNYQNIKRGK